MLERLRSDRRVYLAGKTDINDWRHDMGDFREHVLGHEPQSMAQLAALTLRLNSPLEDWTCIGPFFISCDHGCFHGKGSHGVGTGRSVMCGEPLSRSQIASLLQAWIRRADLVFEWFDKDAVHAHGTLVEIGYAKALVSRC